MITTGANVLNQYTIGTLFSGIGVPDLAARLLSINTLWQVEKDAFCQQVLRKNFPEAKLYSDIFDVQNLPYVDLIVAGFPCQPFSLAGKRQGEKDERYLVPEMLRIIDETQPRVYLLENVPGFASIDDGRTFKQLLGALAEMGMDAEWGHLRASDFGAPHERERWWLVGYSNQERLQGKRPLREQIVATRYGKGKLKSTSNGAAQQCATQSRLGRVIDGTPSRVDRFTPYPAQRGQAQFSFEPPRVTRREKQDSARIQALGNTMAFDVAFTLISAIKIWLETEATQILESELQIVGL